MTVRLAVSPFLSSVPLIDQLITEPTAAVEVNFAEPSRLAEVLRADEADAALLPVIDLFRGHGPGLVPGIGISAAGPAGSAKLFARVPLAAIGRVSVDQAAGTSVGLLRILLAELFGICPDFFAVKPRVEDLFGETEAVLLVGDHCFEAERFLGEQDLADLHVLDLGDAWFRLTRQPLVFAGWALGSRFAARATPAERADLVHLLTRSRDEGKAHLAELAEREAAAGRLGPGGKNTPEALRHYLQDCLSYQLGEKEMAGMRHFYERCVRHAVCPAGRSGPLTAPAAVAQQ